MKQGDTWALIDGKVEMVGQEPGASPVSIVKRMVKPDDESRYGLLRARTSTKSREKVLHDWKEVVRQGGSLRSTRATSRSTTTSSRWNEERERPIAVGRGPIP
jgi:hypothetical protein